MASTILAPIGQSIQSVAGGIASAPKTYWTDPGFDGIDSLPAIVVGIPSGRRRDPDEADSELSHYDWHLRYPVEIVCDLSEAVTSQDQIVQITEQLIHAIDTHQSSFTSGLVLEAVLSEWSEPQVNGNPKRPLLTVSCTVEVWAFDS
jgi:hypothetical protein